LKNTRKRRHSTQVAANALISSINDNFLELNLFSLSGANSVYLPTNEFLSLNERRFLTGKKLAIKTATLPKVLESLNFNFQKVGCNLLVIDVEGHELDVLKGCSTEFLLSFDFIMCEVSKHERHVGAASFGDITTYLSKRGFLIDFEGPRKIFDDVIYKRQALEQ
jgi:FkbM family methyltransferase